MNTNIKSKALIAVILLIAVALASWVCDTPATQSAYADMGPKPSVTVTIENLDGRVCYGTLLSYRESLGPTSAYSPDSYLPSECDPESKYYDEEFHAIWKAFVEYKDPDGYYYQQTHWKCHETGEISWGYYPPSKFKILLYFPETQTFVSSGIYEEYAFHSYFTATLTETDMTVSQTESVEMDVRKSYDYTWEIISLLVRIVVTVLIELGIAWLFRLRTKRKILSVVIVNAVTQTVMNVVLNILSFFQGAWSLLWYIPIELAVFVIEAVAYGIIFNRMQPKTVEADGDGVVVNPEYLSVGKCVLLSFVANLLSFAAGFVLVLVIPGIF